MFGAILKALRIKGSTHDAVFWDVVRERLTSSARDRQITSMIVDIIDTHPNTKGTLVAMLCGAKFKYVNGKKVHQLKLNTLNIGNNFWIGYSVNLSHGHTEAKIYIGEDGDMDTSEASLVFHDGVIVDGNWVDEIIPCLQEAQNVARLTAKKDEENRAERDAKRANSY